MRIIFLTIFLLTAVKFSAAQGLFPDKCIGTWKGVMHMYSKGVIKDSVTVQFDVKKLNDSTWSWKTNYLSEKMPMVKDYILRQRNNSIYEFTTDEGNGIELKEYVHGNKMYSQFETGGFLLTSFYELTDTKTMVFEVTSAIKSSNASESEIVNFAVPYIQRVVLIRQLN